MLGGLHWVLPKSLGPARVDIRMEGDISRLGVSLLAWSAKAIAKKPPEPKTDFVFRSYRHMPVAK